VQGKAQPRLNEILATRYDARSRERGADLARQGRVNLAVVEPELVEADVLGSSGPCLVMLECISGALWVRCTCPRSLGGHHCEHEWAVVLELDGAGWRLESGGLGKLRLQRAGNWRARLARIDASLAPSPWRCEAEREERIWYVLHLELSLQQGGVIVQTRRSHRLKSGAWSVPSLYRAFEARTPRPPTERDEQILSLLRVAANAYGLHRQHEFALYKQQAEVLVPLMAESGSLRWEAGAHEGLGGPLRYCADEHWRLRCVVRRAARKPHLEVSARWSSGERSEALDGGVHTLPGGFVIVGECIGRLADSRDAAWAESLRFDGALELPEEDLAAFARELYRRGAEVDFEDGLDVVRRDVAPRPRLTLASPAESDLARSEVRGSLEFSYEGAWVPAGTKPALIEHDGALIARQAATEQQLEERASFLGVRRPNARAADVVVPLAAMGELARVLTHEGWSVEGDGARLRTSAGGQLSLKSGIDWFQLDGKLEFDGEAVQLPALLAAVKRKDRFVKLGDGKLGLLPEQWLAQIAPLVSLGDSRRDELRFRTSQAWLLEALLEGRNDVKTDAKFRASVAKLQDFQRIEAVSEPAEFAGELRPYQREGLGWLEFLERQGLGGCLADDMGLGKTVQVLAWIVARSARRSKRAPTLVVAPKSLTHNWIAEARRFAPRVSVLDYTGGSRRALADRLESTDLVVTTYGTMRVDIETLGDVEFDAVVLDEAHSIKNSASLTAKAARLLQAQHRLALSGTPVENHLGELWSLFEFLNPGMLGRSSAFSELLDAPRDSVLDEERRGLLARVVRPFVLRRTKEQVLRDLPAKTEQTLECELEPKQRKEYDALRDHYRRALIEGPSDKAVDHFSVLEALLRLRQAACHPGLIDPRRVDEPSAKLEALFERLAEVLESGHKALVFSQFTSLLAIVRSRLDKAATPYAYVDGQTPAKARASQVERFQNDDACPLLLSSLKAGGVGLNLTAADYVFLLDPWWNPAAESQAIGRAHRIGQKRSVFAYRLVCTNTIEERVLELQSRKRELAAVILDGEATTLRDLTREDLERLLR
jgi:superfamily II DNA or RNA helicase